MDGRMLDSNDECRIAGAKAERERIIEKLKFDACPAEYKDGRCPREGLACSQCWREYLEEAE